MTENEDNVEENNEINEGDCAQNQDDKISELKDDLNESVDKSSQYKESNNNENGDLNNAEPICTNNITNDDKENNTTTNEETNEVEANVPEDKPLEKDDENVDKEPNPQNENENEAQEGNVAEQNEMTNNDEGNGVVESNDEVREGNHGNTDENSPEKDIDTPGNNEDEVGTVKKENEQDITGETVAADGSSVEQDEKNACDDSKPEESVPTNISSIEKQDADEGNENISNGPGPENGNIAEQQVVEESYETKLEEPNSENVDAINQHVTGENNESKSDELNSANEGVDEKQIVEENKDGKHTEYNDDLSIQAQNQEQTNDYSGISAIPELIQRQNIPEECIQRDLLDTTRSLNETISSTTEEMTEVSLNMMVSAPITQRSPAKRPVPPKTPRNEYSFKRSLPTFRKPEVSKLALQMKEKAINAEPIPDLDDTIYDQIIYSLTEERRERVLNHEFKRGALINRAIVFTREFQLKNKKQLAHIIAQNEFRQVESEIKSSLEQFDKETKIKENELLKESINRKEAMKERHIKELTEHESRWNSESMFKHFNHASARLTTLRGQISTLLAQNRFDDAEQLTKLADQQKALEELNNYEIMQNSFNESQRRLIAKQQEELDFLETDLEVKRHKFIMERIRERRILENKEKVLELRKDSVNDKEKTWNRARLKATMINSLTRQRSAALAPTNRLTRGDIGVKECAPLSLPPLKSNLRRVIRNNNK